MQKRDWNRNLSTEFLKYIGDYMLVETPLAKADICLVFGNHAHAAELADRAADLYKQGYFKLIVVSGGVPMKDGRLEADCMRDVLLARGVPASAILTEDKAQNSGQNIRYSRALLEKTFGTGAVKSILAVGHIHASRRFLMTIENDWPEVTKMFTTINCFSVPKNLWYTDPVFRQEVLDEYKKIAPYKAQGLIKEIDLKKINQEIAQLPKPASGPPPKFFSINRRVA